MALAKTQDWGQTQAPHWMRLLEEKYQRLHAKIVNQAARFSHRRRTSLAASRVLRESQRKHASSCSRINTADQNQNALVDNQDELLEAETPLPLALEAERQQIELEEEEREEQINNNGAVLSCDYSPPGLRAKTAKSLSQCVIKQNSDHSINPRPQTQHGTRSSGYIDTTGQAVGIASNNENCSNINDIHNKATPLSSGVVTRVSSAYPFTRVSSEYFCDTNNTVSRSSPRIIVTTDEGDQGGHAEQLNFALNLQLENQEYEFEEEEFVFRTSSVEDFILNPKCYSRLRYCASQKDDEDTMNVKCHTERDDAMARGRRRRRAVTRPVKTSVSRISHKTSKSCPATLLDINNENDIFNNNNNNNNIINNSVIDNNGNKNDFGCRRPSNHNLLPPKPGVSLEPLTAQGLQAGRMRVFARMSLEARHAIDETLKEMKMEEGTQQQLPKSGIRDDAPLSFVEESINNNTSADSIRNNVSVGTGEDPQTIDQRMKSLLTDSNKNQQSGAGGDNFSSDASVLSSDSQVYATNKGVNNNNNRKDGLGSIPSRNRLPLPSNGPGHFSKDSNNNNQIPGVSLDSKLYKNSSRRLQGFGETLESFQDRFPTSHAPLPAIKQHVVNRNFRETTFEITPADFDIRFREIITCQKGDRETPPLDVRQQSIDKCQQWLVRYTPRR